MSSTENKDRNFDGLSERFARKIYGGLKGDIRLDVIWRDLQDHLKGRLESPTKVLDAGAGLGQLAIRLAESGHRVTINDLSEEMLALATKAAEERGVKEQMEWLHQPLQTLPEVSDQPFDLVMCHAVLEWLAEPQSAISVLDKLLSDDGWLSLTFYNRDSLIYRNLIRGNFNKAVSDDFSGDPNSLTPPNPLVPKEVLGWVEKQGFQVVAKSGIRVFHDYVRSPGGGNKVSDAVREMELLHSNREPFLWLGRYIHLLCRRKDNVSDDPASY